MKNLGERLKSLRKQSGLSQEQVAKATGVTRAAVSLWESGQTSNLKHESLRRVAGFFDLSIDELIAPTSKAEIATDQGRQCHRLMLAAIRLAGWHTAAKVAEKLTAYGYPTSPQSITNWKARGLSSEAILKCSRIIGCNPLWLESGDGEMVGASNTAAPSEAELIASSMTDEQREAWLAIGRLMNENRSNP